MSRVLAVIALLVLSSPLPAAETPQFIYEADELELLLADTTVRQKTADPDSELTQLVGKPLGNPVTEARLQSILLQLPLPLDTETLSRVHKAIDRGGVIHVWMSLEGHRPVSVPAIDTAATASLVLRRHTEHLAAEQLHAKVLAGTSLPFADARSWTLLVEKTPADELPIIRKALLDAIDAGQAAEAALIAYAKAHGDHDALVAVLQRGEVERLHPEMAALLDVDTDTQAQLLRVAVARTDLRDAIVGFLGPHLHAPWAWNAASESLASSKAGTSAAVMLAQHADDAQLHRLKDIVSGNGQGASRALLALHLDDSQEARNILAHLLREQPDGPFSRQIKEWLQ